MVDSGIAHTTETIDKFNEMKVSHNAKYLIYKIENEC
jgi:hypothetical protein